MPRKEELELRHKTNLYDLLDDGVENGSDLKVLRDLESREAAEKAVGQWQPAASAPHTNKPATDNPPTSDQISPKRSLWGSLLGLLLCAAGIRFIAWPVDTIVMHARTRGRISLEHVTPATSQFYGLAALAIGLSILLYSLAKIRR